MIIDDLVVLTRAVPELRPRGGGSKGVCLAGFSPTYGFIRVDPVRPKTKVKRWDVIKVDLERKPRDTRHESWQVVGANDDWHSVNDRVEVVSSIKKAEERKALVESNLAPCVRLVSERHDSLCLIKPEVIHSQVWANNPQFGKPFQTQLIPELNEEWVNTKADYPIVPRITYTCPDCRLTSGKHDQIFIGWDAFEYLRKNPDKPDGFWENARFYDAEYEHYFFVGNQGNQRTSYMIIGVIWIKKSVMSSSTNYSRLANFVYLVRNPESGYIQFRLQDSFPGDPDGLEIVCKIEHDEPAKLEIQLRSEYKNHRVGDDWYNLDMHAITDIRNGVYISRKGKQDNESKQLPLL